MINYQLVSLVGFQTYVSRALVITKIISEKNIFTRIFQILLIVLGKKRVFSIFHDSSS